MFGLTNGKYALEIRLLGALKKAYPSPMFSSCFGRRTHNSLIGSEPSYERSSAVGLKKMDYALYR